MALAAEQCNRLTHSDMIHKNAKGLQVGQNYRVSSVNHSDNEKPDLAEKWTRRDRRLSISFILLDVSIVLMVRGGGLDRSARYNQNMLGQFGHDLN